MSGIPSSQPGTTIGRVFRFRTHMLLALMSLAISSGCTIMDTQGLRSQSHELATHPMMNPPDPTHGGPEDGRYLPEHTPPASTPPSELARVSLPRYRIGPPDVLLIQAIRLVPKSPYFVQSNDWLQITVSNALPTEPIGLAPYQVGADGTVNLGATYGPVKLVGKTLDEAQAEIAKSLSRIINQPQVAVSLLQPAGMQQIFGEHIIGPDGYVSLGIYGSVYVAGMTTDEARVAIEKHMSTYMDEPKVSVDVLIYNSNYFYIITQGGGFGDNLVRIPVTGSETVLDAIAQVGGLTQVSSTRMWIARPGPKDMGCDQILPIDWQGITMGASTATNYQILPGDRVFIAEDRFMAASSIVNKVINPVERALGFTLLGSQTIQFLQRFPRGFSF
ncbi:MAG: polysaccharide biosynthesis/export family protein [Planctomycetales bacterium]|nr:polysaccharide biosynthesis/export family protein [Planctomycetales bacterium]